MGGSEDRGGTRAARGGVRLVLSALVGAGFFLLPIPVADRWTVPFDLLVRALLDGAPRASSLYALGLVLAGAAGSLRRGASEGGASRSMRIARWAAVPFALAYATGVGPTRLVEGIGAVIWSTLARSVAVIVPVGAGLVLAFVRYGLLELVGTLLRPVMRPLFRLPGRAALDSLTSWVGSYSVGLYLTRRLLLEGYYTRREAYTIVTCFSTVSIGFVAVVADTLGLLRLFPLVFATYFVAVYALAALLARTWPVTRIPDTYVGPPRPEAESPGGEPLARTAWRRAVAQAQGAPGPLATLRDGLVDGLRLAASILGGIVLVGTAALWLARETPVVALVGRPLAPVLAALGIPDAPVVAPATVAGIAEMYIPALLAREAALPARFFVATLSVSQLVFFSSVGPMMIEMFEPIPVRARELVALFFVRTALLVPFLAAVTLALDRLGLLVP